MAARPTDDQVVSKGEFARISNVSPGRVTQWIAEGKITGDALVGEGRAARIRVRAAQSQLKRHLDPNQMTANGVRTRIPTGPLVPPTPEPVEADDSAPSDDRSPLGDLTEERTRLAKEQADRVAMMNAALRGELIKATEAERRWSEQMVTLRSRMLAVANDLPLLLPHLTAHDIATIDRSYRDAMDHASRGDA